MNASPHANTYDRIKRQTKQTYLHENTDKIIEKMVIHLHKNIKQQLHQQNV